MPPSGVFISYRRDDSAAEAKRLFEWLSTYPAYKDTAHMSPGERFRDTIAAAIQNAVVIVVIGPSWLTLRAEGAAQARLFEQDDIVREEVRLALSEAHTVIPLLVKGAKLPKNDELPPDIAGLKRHTVIPLPDADVPFALLREVERHFPVHRRVGAAVAQGLMWTLPLGLILSALRAALPLLSPSPARAGTFLGGFILAASLAFLFSWRVRKHAFRFRQSLTQMIPHWLFGRVSRFTRGAGVDLTVLLATALIVGYFQLAPVVVETRETPFCSPVELNEVRCSPSTGFEQTFATDASGCRTPLAGRYQIVRVRAGLGSVQRDDQLTIEATDGYVVSLYGPNGTEFVVPELADVQPPGNGDSCTLKVTGGDLKHRFEVAFLIGTTRQGHIQLPVQAVLTRNRRVLGQAYGTTTRTSTR